MRYIELTEAPIEDFVSIEPEDEANMARGFTQIDADLHKSKKGVRKIRNAFDKTPFVFNFYIFMETLDGRSKNSLDRNPKRFLERKLNQKIDTENKITIIYLNNATADYVPMTAWILAHRLSHIFHAKSTKEQFPDDIGEKEVIKKLAKIVNIIHPDAFEPEKITHSSLLDDYRFENIANTLGNTFFTMKSARDLRLKMLHDVYGELMAQYLFTGKVSFLRTSDWRHGEKTLIQTEADQQRLETHADEINALLASAEKEIEENIERTLQFMVGKIYSF